jgi:hypothetical protein
VGLTVALAVALATGSTVGVAAGAGLGTSLGCNVGVAVTPCTVGGMLDGFGNGMVVADAGMVDVPVGMIVGCVNSGVVGVFVLVSERSCSGGGVVVISGSGVGVDGSSVGSGVGVSVGDGDGSSSEILEVEVGVTLAVGVSVGDCVGVAVRQGPSVERARYCDHSSSCIRISRNPPGNDSQISLFCGLLRPGPGIDPDGCGVEVEAVEDAGGDDITVGVSDGKVVAVI